MKVYMLPPEENWICDRFTDEWTQHNSDLVTFWPDQADVIWLMADWCYNKLPYELLRQRKVVTTNFHIVPEKFDDAARADFMRRDAITDLYHASCNKTAGYLKQIGATKPIQSELVWVNGLLWRDLTNDADRSIGGMFPPVWNRRQRLKKEMGLTEKDFLIGSFQRDTEGSDLKSPKLEKGPDVFCDYVALAKKRLEGSEMQPIVLLGGWRRQYVIDRLKEMGVRYIYHELPDFEKLNEMYNALDLYVVASRYEGGPQALVECAATRTPVISTNVGLAPQVLAPRSIAAEVTAEALMNSKPDIDYAYDKVQPLLMPQGFVPFRKMLEDLCHAR